MKRYRLTKSGVCDCMLPDDNGPWVKYEDAEQAHRDATEDVAKAHKRGWEQAKREAFEIARTTQIGYIQTTIAAMGYKERTNG